MTLSNRIKKLEKAVGIDSGVDDIPILAVIVSSREQVKIMEGLQPGNDVFELEFPDNFEGAVCTFEQVMEWRVE